MDNIAVMLIFVDNFDEVMETIEEIRRPVMVALIDRKLGLLARDADAVFRKFEKDKFLLVLTKDSLRDLKEGNFAILQGIRDLEMGNSIPVTLSLGIGIGGETLAITSEYAQAAMDLALGRGGDQAVIKDGEKLVFFGGTSPEKPSGDHITARIKFWALSGLMEIAGNIIIMGHRNMDEDCLGSTVGIYKLADAKGRKCRILTGKEMSSVASTFEKLMELEEYADVFIDEQQALAECNNETLVIIVDTNRPSLVESEALLGAAGKLVVIDHHRLATDFIQNAALIHQEPFASSTCELICEMMTHLKTPVKFKPIEADLMLAGITIDTKFFAQKTGQKTFAAAAFLRKNGADGTRVKMYLQEDIADVTAIARTIANVRIIDGKYAISECDSNQNRIKISAKAADELMGISGTAASFVLADLGAGDSGGGDLGAGGGDLPSKTYISARSLGLVNVQLIMEQMGGGGHQTMAAVTVEYGIEKARATLLNILGEMENTL